MIKMFFNFYLISFAIRPWRLIQNFYNYFVHGIEKARYMRFFTEIFFLRKKWIKTEEVSGWFLKLDCLSILHSVYS